MTPRGSGEVTEQTGESERLLWRFGRRYAAVVRLVVMVPIGAIAPLRASPEHAFATAVVVGVVALWTVVYAVWLVRGAGRRLLAADVVVLAAAGTSIQWTDAVEDVNTGWLRLLIMFACATYPWYTPPHIAGGAALATAGGLVVNSVVAGGAHLLQSQLWVLAIAALFIATWALVLRAARRADRLAAHAADARRTAQVEAAVRADERELASSLHDTAATTMLMVGSGQVPAGAAWLPQQVHRDLERLRARGGVRPEHADLVELLRVDLATVHLAVELEAPEALSLPFEVARAVADATGEALTNVRRHSGADRAVVRLRGDGRWLRLEVADDGCGFAVDGVPATRRGLRHSVHDRMARIGGTATISSAVGAGTVVRLEWAALQ